MIIHYYITHYYFIVLLPTNIYIYIYICLHADILYNCVYQ